jgi:hypothetical protein
MTTTTTTTTGFSAEMIRAARHARAIRVIGHEYTMCDCRRENGESEHFACDRCRAEYAAKYDAEVAR